MARPFKRRKAKSRPVVLKRKGKKTKVSFAGAGSLIKDVWDPRRTVKQNYEKLGITSTLKGYTGVLLRPAVDSLANTKIRGELRAIDASNEDPSPSGDDLNPEVEINPSSKNIGVRINRTGVAGALVSKGAESSEYLDRLAEIIKEKRQTCRSSRHASLMEAQILKKLIEKYGLDYVKMAKDIEINTYQLSPGLLKSKIRRLIVET